MLSFHTGMRVFLALEPCDMRKSFDGLHGLVLDRLGEDPTSGALFVFTNKRRNRLKIFLFDGSGAWVLAKRLERGTFNWPAAPRDGERKIRLSQAALQMLLEGIDLERARPRRWHRKQAS